MEFLLMSIQFITQWKCLFCDCINELKENDVEIRVPEIDKIKLFCSGCKKTLEHVFIKRLGVDIQ
jgi:hypothetical protein